jgi:hypothetical protein
MINTQRIVEENSFFEVGQLAAGIIPVQANPIRGTTPYPQPCGAYENARVATCFDGGRSPRRTPLRVALRDEGSTAMVISFRGGSPRRRRHTF